MTVKILTGDCRDVLRTLQDESVHCIVTSPPYFQLRDYQVAGQIGLEATVGEWLAELVGVFRECRRVLRKDGTLWLNCGDSYAGGGPKLKASPSIHLHSAAEDGGAISRHRNPAPRGFKQKDRMMLPARLAIALCDDGWWLRDEIVWCLSPSTRVYAATAGTIGPATIHDLVRLDPLTVRLWTGVRWSRVLGWGPTQCAAPIRLRLRSGECISCTPGHEWPLVDGRLLRADSLRVGDVLATTALPEPSAPAGHGIDTDLAWLAGLYVAEGSASGDAMQIAGHVKEVARYERLRAIAERHGGSLRLHVAGNTVNAVLHGAMLWGAVRHFVTGRIAKDKHLHPRAWAMSNNHLQAFLDGYLAGDGHWDARNLRWRIGFCRNDGLANDLRTLAARLGATITLKPTYAWLGRVKRFESYRGEIRFTASKHRNGKCRAELVAIEPSAAGTFYDIAIADEPHLFALASGILTHNCKPNPMPSSVQDRTTPAHEMLYMFSKSRRYYYDANAIAEPARYDPANTKKPDGWDTGAGGHGKVHRNGREKGARSGNKERKCGVERGRPDSHLGGSVPWEGVARNKRSVWTIATEAFAEAHFAVFPSKLVEPCILAGCPEAGVVLDPFGGAGTVGLAADRLQRDAILIELNPEYALMAQSRIEAGSPLFAQVNCG